MTTAKISEPTSRYVRRKILSRIQSINPTTQESILITTTTKKIPFKNFSDIDDDIASILPALTSTKPRKTTNAFATYAKVTNKPPVNETLTNYSFDQILQHQYKIKGLNEDFENEKFDTVYKKSNEKEQEKFIGLLGSQVSKA